MTKKINYIRKNKTQIRKVRRRKRKSMFSDLNKKNAFGQIFNFNAKLRIKTEIKIELKKYEKLKQEKTNPREKQKINIIKII